MTKFVSRRRKILISVGIGQIRQNRRPCPAKVIVMTCGIGGGGGRKHLCRNAGQRKDVLFIQPSGGLSAAEDRTDGGLRKNRADVVGNGMTDGGIGRAFDVAGGAGVPQRNVMGMQKRSFFVHGHGNRRAEQCRQRLPEPVARMSGIKLYLAGFDRRKGTEDQNTAVPVVNGGKRMDGHTADYLRWDCFHYTTAC